jgi:hypothetical protein
MSEEKVIMYLNKLGFRIKERKKDTIFLEKDKPEIWIEIKIRDNKPILILATQFERAYSGSIVYRLFGRKHVASWEGLLRELQKGYIGSKFKGRYVRIT